MSDFIESFKECKLHDKIFVILYIAFILFGTMLCMWVLITGSTTWCVRAFVLLVLMFEAFGFGMVVMFD